MTSAKTWIATTLLLAAPLAGADRAYAGSTFDVATDFSIAENPNGAWAYGYSTTLTGSFISHTDSGTTSGVEFWRTNINSGAPASNHNPTPNVVNLSTLQLQPNQYAFHPGPANQYAKTRLTIPSTSAYEIKGTFSGADTQGTSTDVHILVNGTSIFNGIVAGFGPNTGPSFSFIQTLQSKDALEFAVGFGLNSNFFFDTTALAASITAVPEPSSALLWGVGGVLVWARRALSSRRSVADRRLTYKD